MSYIGSLENKFFWANVGSLEYQISLVIVNNLLFDAQDLVSGFTGAVEILSLSFLIDFSKRNLEARNILFFYFGAQIYEITPTLVTFDHDYYQTQLKSMYLALWTLTIRTKDLATFMISRKMLWTSFRLTMTSM